MRRGARAPAVARLPSDVEETRLTALTAADPARRIEALRRLGMSDLPAREKAEAAVRALAEESPAVRRAAARELRSLGLPEHLCANLGRLASEDPVERALALHNLARALQGDARAAGLLVPAVLEGLLSERDRTVACAALDLLRAVPGAATAPATLGRLLHHVVPMVEGMDGDGRGRLILFLEAAAAEAPRAVAATLGDVLLSSGTPRARRFVLGRMLRLPLDPALRETCAAGLAEELASLDPGLEAAEAIDALVCAPREAARALAQRAPRFRARSEAIVALDRVATAPAATDTTRLDVARVLLDALRTWPDTYAPALVACALWHDDRLPRAVRREAAGALLDQMPRLTAPDLRREMGEAVAALGTDALEPLVRAMEPPRPAADRIEAARILGMCVRSAAQGPARLLSRAADLLLHDEALLPAWETLGRIAASRASPRPLAARIASETKARWEARRDPIAALQAIAWLPAAARLTARERLETLSFLLALLRSDFAAPPQEGVRADPERVWRETSLQAECVPVLLEGIGRAVLEGDLPRGAAEAVFGEMLGRWKEIRSLRRIWGPSDLARCCHILGRLAAAGRVGPASVAHGIRELSAALDSPSAVRALADAATAFHRDAAIGAACADLARQALAASARPDALHEEESRLLPALLGVLGSRRDLPDEIRRQVARALLEGARSDPALFRSPIERIAAADAVPASTRARLRAWLDQEMGHLTAAPTPPDADRRAGRRGT